MPSVEQLLSSVLVQMPFVALMYYLFSNERSERIKATQAQVDALTKTLEKNDQRHAQVIAVISEQHRQSYERACSLYERFLDQTNDALKVERNRAARRSSAASTDLTGEHSTQPKIGI